VKSEDKGEDETSFSFSGQRLGASGRAVSCGCGGGRRCCAQQSALTPPEADWLLRLPGSGNLTGAIAASSSRVSRLQAVYPRLRYTELDACERAHNSESLPRARAEAGEEMHLVVEERQG
jgi:hypothetical protein